MHKIYFHDFNIKSTLHNKLTLKRFLVKIFKDQKIPLEKVDIIFCTNTYLRGLNKRYLNHDYNTDTITFKFSGPHKAIVGEAYISIDQIKENSTIFQVTYQEELVRVIIHSCLHLCGLKDKPKSKGDKMSGIQEKYLNKWIVSRETQIGR